MIAQLSGPNSRPAIQLYETIMHLSLFDRLTPEKQRNPFHSKGGRHVPILSDA